MAPSMGKRRNAGMRVMAKYPNQSEPDVATRIMEHMVRMSPKQHKEMKLGKRKAKAELKECPASKGCVHKGKSSGASARAAMPRAHSRSGSRQDWPEYCLFIFIQAWFPPKLL
jgi:hypothetical protein